MKNKTKMQNRTKVAMSTIFALSLLLVGCSGDPITEKHQPTRDNIIDVSDKIVKVDLGNELLLGQGELIIVDDYLILNDYLSKKELLHIFDLDNLEHVWSGLRKGRGRGEVLHLTKISADPKGRRFYTMTNSRMVSFDLDSMMNVRDYAPASYANIAIDEDEKMLRSASSVKYLSDTLSLALMFSIFKGSSVSFNNGMIYSEGGSISVQSINITRGDMRVVERSYPDGIEPFFFGNGSLEHNIVVEGHHSEDLLSISDFDGNLICNVFGPNWGSREKRQGFMDNIEFINDQIFTVYSGEVVSKDIMAKPQCITIFGLDGDYIKTINLGVGVFDYVYDAKNDRLLLFVEDDENPFVYLDMRHINQVG